jgi:hypothetical protein
MTTSDNVTERHHPGIEWVDIHGDGSETPRRGVVWAPAAAFSGIGSAWWVLPEPGSAPEGSSEPTALLVARLPGGETQMALLGEDVPRTRVYRPGRVMGRRWVARMGRLVFPGEVIRETHPASVFARREAAQARPGPTHVVLKPMTVGARTEMEAFERTVRALTPERTQ